MQVFLFLSITSQAAKFFTSHKRRGLRDKGFIYLIRRDNGLSIWVLCLSVTPWLQEHYKHAHWSTEQNFSIKWWGGWNPRESEAFICDRYRRTEPGILKPGRNWTHCADSLFPLSHISASISHIHICGGFSLLRYYSNCMFLTILKSALILFITEAEFVYCKMLHQNHWYSVASFWFLSIFHLTFQTSAIKRISVFPLHFLTPFQGPYLPLTKKLTGKDLIWLVVLPSCLFVSVTSSNWLPRSTEEQTIKWSVNTLALSVSWG